MRRPYSLGSSQFSFGPGMMTPAVKMLIWTNVGIFVTGVLIPPLGRLLIDLFGLRPQAVLTGLRIWQPFTYLFLHGGFSHILFNMLVLWMFGVQLERLWGSSYFLRYYFITGIGAGVATIGAGLLPFAFSEPTYLAVTIGASGAIYGLLMAFAIYYPDTPILLFLLFPVPAKYFVMIIGAITFLSVPRSAGVAHVAHLGGLVVGYVYLKRGGGSGVARFGRFGLMAEIKYRYLRWKMGRLRRKFNVHPGGSGGDDDWNGRVH
ncbi:MAG: rhomboid family intramembrane serine protease [Vicinamibacterales bacterium]|jgi:membrane associated rhomboid family serine protease|nr:rhomboid family intramembrane serine protease [Vicinamibacterales bacterium]MDP6758855.1 rhomboid family intramembrane serine protease [Chloroflexota bacterium]